MASPRVGYGVFQSTHPSGVRRPPSRRPASDVYFNPRTPVGCDHDYQGLLPCVGYFNPRTPVGCDHRPIKGAGLLSGISIHAPQWGATLVRVEMATYRTISIHAPQWGATNRARHGAGQPVISIHAPQWGATCRTATVWSPGRYFNPRTPVGCDLVAVWDIGVIVGISIHAPQWGATIRRSGSSARCRNHFNPRTPVGCDLEGHTLYPGTDISIHAPQWGATRDWHVRHLLGQISIHAPQWGATTDKRDHQQRRRISIHAPQWGATELRASDVTPQEFQSTHPSGVRLGWRGFAWPTSRNIKPRTPVGCDDPAPSFFYTQPKFPSTHPSGVRPSQPRLHYNRM